MVNDELTQDLLRELFDYRDGELYWKVSRGNSVKSGDRAGSVRPDGYRSISINNKHYLTHRLIFLYHRGYLPKYLDHVDGDKSNNGISNLRETTKAQNAMNMKKPRSMNSKPTTSEHKGVSWDKDRKKWRAYIIINSDQKHLGLFDSEIEAAKAYDKAAIRLFGEFKKLNYNDNI